MTPVTPWSVPLLGHLHPMCPIDQSRAWISLQTDTEIDWQIVRSYKARSAATQLYPTLPPTSYLDGYIRPLNVPAYSGAMIGHIADKFTIQLLEPAVS